MADVKEALVPDIGDFTDVPVVEVLVAEGDRVEQEQPMVTLESDKASMDVPAPFAGTIAELAVSVGDTVSEGDRLAAISVDGSEPGDEASGGDEAEGEDGEDDQLERDGDGEGDEAGGGAAARPGDASPDRDRADDREAEPTARPANAVGGPAGKSGAAASRDPSEPRPGGGEREAPIYAGPGARRRARELGVDLTRVEGTGRKGRITVEDVERGERQEAGAPGLGGLPDWPSVDFEKYGPVEREKLSRIKQISGPNLQRNWITIPHVTHHEEADVTELEAFRKEMNAELADSGVKLTMVALILKALVASLKEYPQFNSSIEGDELVLKRYYHLGFAADTPQGLLVPVIRDVDRKGLAEIAAELAELSAKAREGKLGPSEMQGGTFTLSSLGGIGGTAFTPIINAPEVAILGATRTRMTPVWNGSEFEPRLMLPLDLSYDHRVIDGAAAARFCAHLAGVLSDLRRSLI